MIGISFAPTLGRAPLVGPSPSACAGEAEPKAKTARSPTRIWVRPLLTGPFHSTLWRILATRSKPVAMTRVAVSGASGLVGRRLCAALAASGHKVLRLVRRAPKDGEIAWNPARSELDARALEGIDGFVHL